MALEARLESGAVAPAVIEANDDMGAPLSVAIVQIRDAAGNAKTVWQAMTALVSAPQLFGYANSSSPATVYTPFVIASAVGGTPPYTYLWSIVTTTGTWLSTAGTSAKTAFQAINVDPGDFAEATATCTITDSAGTSAESPPVGLNASNLGDGV